MKKATIESKIRIVHNMLADARHADDIRNLNDMLLRLIMMEPDDKEEEDED